MEQSQQKSELTRFLALSKCSAFSPFQPGSRDSWLVIFQNYLSIPLALPFDPIINWHLWINRLCTIREDSIPPSLTLFPTISVCKPMFQPTGLCFQNIPCTFPPSHLPGSCGKHAPHSFLLDKVRCKFHLLHQTPFLPSSSVIIMPISCCICSPHLVLRTSLQHGLMLMLNKSRGSLALSFQHLTNVLYAIRAP